MVWKKIKRPFLSKNGFALSRMGLCSERWPNECKVFLTSGCKVFLRNAKNGTKSTFSELLGSWSKMSDLPTLNTPTLVVPSSGMDNPIIVGQLLNLNKRNPPTAYSSLFDWIIRCNTAYWACTSRSWLSALCFFFGMGSDNCKRKCHNRTNDNHYNVFRFHDWYFLRLLFK